MIINRNYKVSTFPFIGQIPSEWNEYKNRELFFDYKKKNQSDLELLSVSQKKGVIKQSEITEKKDISNEDKSNYKHVMIGDIVYNKMRMWQGAVGVSNYEGIVSPAYIVLRIVDKNRVSSSFIHYLFRSQAYISQSNKYSYGLCDDMNSLRYEDFKSMISIAPSISEQNSIVTYLNNVSQRVDDFVKQKQTYIKLLGEYKKSKINEYVTRGLNPSLPMKDSGIKWIGLIPESWRIIKLKKLVDINKSSSRNESNKIALENIESETGKLVYTASSPFEGTGTPFSKEDVLFGKLRPYLAKVLMPSEDGFCVNELLVFKPKHIFITREYLFLRLLSYDFIQNVNSSTYGTKMPRANWDFIGNIEIPLPSKEDQLKIYNEYCRLNNDIGLLISKAEKQIELIREYHQSLVNEVITGSKSIN